MVPVSALFPILEFAANAALRLGSLSDKKRRPMTLDRCARWLNGPRVNFYQA
jgi:hypothetical protein